MAIVLFTDSSCDLTRTYVDENNIEIMSLRVNINNMDIPDDLGLSLSNKEFYKMVKEGAMPITSQVNAFTFEEGFRKYVSKGDSIIYFGLSSPLSGTVNSARIAKENILEEYKDADISIIDTLSASCGVGLLVYYACEMIKAGWNKEEIVNWAEENKLKIQHWITVEDLNHLKRGGRISSATAIVGTMLSIKPIITINNLGALINLTKSKGRKKAIKFLYEKVKENIVNSDEQTVMITHGDCEEEAETLKELILSNIKVKSVIVSPIGPIIGTHTGPGTIAVAMLSNGREGN